MLKYKLCRICMKQKKALEPLDTGFVKIFEFSAIGDLVADILIDFTNANVDQSDDLPHIICIPCFENLVKCREFKKLIVQNGIALADLAKKSPDEMENIIAEPLVRIEKVKTSNVVTDQLGDPFPQESLYSENEDDFPIEEEVATESVEAVQPRFLCCCCPLQFSEEFELIQHMKTDHAEIRSKLNIAPVDRDLEEVKQCELCLKFIFGFEKLLEHQAQYKNCKQCFECGGFYQKKGKLDCQCEIPIEPESTESKTVVKEKCEVCGNYYKNLKAHVKLQHEGKLLKCKKCDFTTFQKTKMMRHVANNHLERTFPCPYAGCEKKFVSSNCRYLKVHMIRHTGEKAYVCKFCGKAFADCSDCKRHEWQHTGVSPYMCSKCNKMFLRKNHLLMHEGKCASYVGK